LSDELFMVPVARDDRGCVVYRVASSSHRFDRTAFWRVAEGHFSTNPEAARCI
jgi:hypothetical protein